MTNRSALEKHMQGQFNSMTESGH